MKVQEIETVVTSLKNAKHYLLKAYYEICLEGSNCGGDSKDIEWCIDTVNKKIMLLTEALSAIKKI